MGLAMLANEWEWSTCKRAHMWVPVVRRGGGSVRGWTNHPNDLRWPEELSPKRVVPNAHLLRDEA